MSAVWAWFRLDLRQRWRSLLVLAILVAVASGTVMTAVAGARRGRTALDRLLEQTLPATAVALPNEAGFDWEPIRALPEVEALTGFAVSFFEVDDIPSDDWVGAFPQTDMEVFRSIERPVMLEGRLLDSTREDEVMASPNFLEHYGYHVGDTVTLRLYLPEQIDIFDQADPGPPAGPTVEATIVGVPRSTWYTDHVGDEGGGLVPSPALFLNHQENFLGTGSGLGYINALIRLRGGAADIPEFKEDLARITGRDDIDVWDLAASADHSRDVTGFEANSLMTFALAATIAALFIVGQAVVRHASSTVSDLEPLRAVGMKPYETVAAVIIGPAMASLLGWMIGSAGAVVASRWFPIGTAVPLEPSPGVSADLTVLLSGGVAILALGIGGTALVAGLGLRARARDVPVRRSAVAAGAVRAGMPVPVVVGSRFALEPGKGRTAVPVRPALFGAVVGVLGVLAALTFTAGIRDASDNLERFGVTYELGGYFGFNGFDFAPADEVLPALAADPDVASVNSAREDVAQVNDVAVSLFTIDPVDQPIEIVLTKGRVPSGPDEVALAPNSAEAAGVDVGDTVAFTGSLGTRDLTVSGIAFVPQGPHNDYASGGWITAAGYDSLFDGFKFHFVLIDVADGADIATVAERLGATGIGIEAPQPVLQVAELRQVQRIPLFLAGFLLLLALGAVGHALATTVRRRSHDLAVLRAVGMTRRQSRLVVATQSSLIALVGLIAGIPLGLALGRTVWRYVADQTPVYYLAPAEWAALILMIPLALIAANLLAVVPSRRAARLQLARVLRAE